MFVYLSGNVVQQAKNNNNLTSRTQPQKDSPSWLNYFWPVLTIHTRSSQLTAYVPKIVICTSTYLPRVGRPKSSEFANTLLVVSTHTLYVVPYYYKHYQTRTVSSFCRTTLFLYLHYIRDIALRRDYPTTPLYLYWEKDILLKSKFQDCNVWEKALVWSGLPFEMIYLGYRHFLIFDYVLIYLENLRYLLLNRPCKPRFSSSYKLV